MIRVCFLALLCSAALCGCGGGGGGNSGVAPVTGNSRAGGVTGSAAAGVGGGTASLGSSGPSISGVPPTAVLQDEQYVFEPTTTATPTAQAGLVFSITNRPSWASFDSATGRLSGTPTATDVGTDRGIRIQVSDGTGSVALPAFDITVVPASHGSVTVRWVPPTENVDNSPLMDLAGFDIYWGTQPGDLSKKVEVDTGGATTYVFDNLPPATYYFAVAAFNSEGTQSALSPPASITVH